MNTHPSLWHWLLFALACLVLVGCATLPLAPPAVEQAVKAEIEDAVSAWNARDLDRHLSHWAEDAKVDSRAAGRVVSKAEYRSALDKFFHEPENRDLTLIREPRAPAMDA